MEYSIDDSYGNGNGRLDPGEAVTLHITTLNAGSADAFNVTGNLSTEDINVSILTGSGSYGTLTAGNSNVQSFEIEIDENTPMGDAPVFVFDMAADLNITGYGEFVEYIGQIPVLIVDWDLNHNSPDAIEQCLTSLEVGYERVEEFPENLSLYASIFVCLGTYPDNYVLSADQGQVLADYLEAGGNLYMEGADTWYYDQQFTPTPVHPMFNIGGESDGAGDLSNEEGQPGSIAEGMNYAFSGENSYIDHISAHAPAIMMFMNAVPPYGTGVSQDAGTYKTIGFSFEFGGLQDGDKSKGDLMIEMLDFFGIQGIWTSTEENPEVSSIPVNIYPNPFRDETVIRFENPERGRVSVEIYNLSGQVISRLMDAEVPEGIHEIRWDGSTTAGTRTAEGLYFFRLHTGNGVTTGRLMRIE
jgi:hypothetical protein